MRTRFMVAFTFIGLTLLGHYAQGSDLEDKYYQEIRAKTLNYHFIETGLCERIYGKTNCSDYCLLGLDLGLIYLTGNCVMGGFGCGNVLCGLASVFGGVFSFLGVVASTAGLICRGEQIYKEVNKEEEKAEKHRKIAELIKAANFANIKEDKNQFYFQTKYQHNEALLRAMIRTHQQDHNCHCTLTVSDLVLRIREAVDAGYLIPQNKLGLNGDTGTVGQWAELSYKELIVKLAGTNPEQLYNSFDKAQKALVEIMKTVEKNNSDIDTEGKDFAFIKSKKYR